MTLPPINKDSLSLLKRYLYEVALVVLGVSIGFLFVKYDNLNVFIRDKSTVETVNVRLALGEATKVISENQKVMTELIFLLKERNNNNKDLNLKQ